MIEKKKYFQNKEIEDELNRIKKNYNFNINNEIEVELKKISNISDIKEKYLNYIRLIIRDNTNKKCLIDYLNFLKKFELNLKLINNLSIENYKDEFNYYKVCFTQDECLKYFGETKNNSEKEEFILLLNNILILFKKCILQNKIIDDIITFKNSLPKKNKIQYFNRPIRYENQELFYFKNRANIYHDFETIHFYFNNNPNIEFLKRKVYVIEKILKNNLLNNVLIYKNEDRINLLLLLILYPEDNNVSDYIFNLLISSEININENIIKEIKNSEFNFSEMEYKNICIENLRIKDLLSYEKNDLFNYDYQIENSSKIIKNIKYFLKKILNLKVFDEAFKILYGNDFENPFKDNEFKNKYIDEYLKFVPYRTQNSSGVTDKYTLKSYIFLKRKNIMENINNKKNIKELIREALILGAFLEVIFHEINHFIYAVLFMKDNGHSLSFQTPRKEKLPKIREGGHYFELLLFGTIINQLSLNQALYLLNSKNYNKGVKGFQKGFSKLNKNDLIGNSNFEKFNNLINNNIIDSPYNPSITVKNTAKDPLNNFFIQSYNGNCTCIHRDIDLNELKKFVIIKD